MIKANKSKLMFYQKLGELFYAIAATCKIVSKAEYKILTQLVEEEWKIVNEKEDQFKTGATNQLSIVFKWFDYECMDAEDCFESFVGYFKKHNNFFIAKRKALIIKTINKIADSFRGVNKSELIMITKLQLLFNNN